MRRNRTVQSTHLSYAQKPSCSKQSRVGLDETHEADSYVSVSLTREMGESVRHDQAPGKQ